MLTCRQVSELASQSLDRRLSWRERLAVRLHLLVCSACTRVKHQLEFLRTAARQYARHGEQIEGQARLSPQARERILNTVQRHRE